jgi:hypothetical protein
MDLKRTASEDDKKYIKILETYNDKAFVFSVLCLQSARYYNRLKYGFQLPIIITSSVLSILNGTTGNDHIDNNMKMINTVFNILTALILSVNNTFRFETKANDFKSNGMKFQKLSHLIESKVLEGNINSDFINSVITTYDNIVESIDDDVPSHVCTRVRNEYKTKKHLPTIINGIPKISSPDISARNTSINISPLRRLSAVICSPINNV